MNTQSEPPIFRQSNPAGKKNLDHVLAFIIFLLCIFLSFVKEFSIFNGLIAQTP